MRLLDLTGRNRLLNFTHTKRGSLRVIDEMPDQLCATLLSEQEMFFQPVPEPQREELIAHGFLREGTESGTDGVARREPTATEWASVLGLSTSYEVPLPSPDALTPDKHQGRAIQTLLFPSELESRLRTLAQQSKTAIEETGANILYVCFGFLEWFDSTDEDAKPRLAPLFLVPAAIEKGRLDPLTQTYRYTIKFSGEEVITNLSLREKLRQDFALVLPELDASSSPESYFAAVASMLEKNKPSWRVRRYVSLALLNFSKLLMYLDLDPSNWPEAAPIHSHSIVTQFIDGVEKAGSDEGLPSYSQEYALDDWPQAEEKYPLVDDADSSQHSALVDAMKGENLVVEGPPGTGKSQTITNLIAASIAGGKTVLFVAEKLAALEVVKRRLDQAGLGDFCLELHSHKSNKRKVIEELKGRLGRRGTYRLPRELQEDVHRHEDLKATLKGHVARINTEWRKTGRTPHQIFARAVRYRNEVAQDPRRFHLDDCSGTTFTAARQRELRDAVIRFRDAALGLRDGHDGTTIREHPWAGVQSTAVQAFDREELVRFLERWIAALEDLDQITKRNLDLLPGGQEPGSIGASTLAALEQLLGEVPQLSGSEDLLALPQLRGPGLKQFSEYLDLYNELRTLYETTLEAGLNQRVLVDRERAIEFQSSCRQLGNLAWGEASLAETRLACNGLEPLARELETLGRVVSEVRAVVPPGIAHFLSVNPAGLRELATMMRFAASLPASLTSKRDPAVFEHEAFAEVVSSVRAERDTLLREKEDLSRTFDLGQIPSDETLAEIRAELTGAGFFRWFQPRWRAARRRLLGLGHGVKPKLGELEDALPRLLVFRRRLHAFEQNQTYRSVLGRHFASVETDVDGLDTVYSWFQDLRREYGAGFGSRVALGAALASVDDSVLRGLRDQCGRGELDRADGVGNAIAHLQKAFKPASGLHEEDCELLGPTGVLPVLRAALEKSLAGVEPNLTTADVSLTTTEQLARDVATIQAKRASFDASPADAQLFGGRLQLDPFDHRSQRIGVARATLLLSRWLARTETVRGLAERVYRSPTVNTFQSLAQLRHELAEALQTEARWRAEFQRASELDVQTWTTSDGIAALSGRGRHALKHTPTLGRWLDYCRERSTLASCGLGKLTGAVDADGLKPELIEAAFWAGAFDLLSREILTTDSHLARFSGATQDSFRKQFVEYDEKLKRLQRERIASIVDQRPVPPGRATGRVAEYTELGLIQHECSKKSRHVALRELLRRAGNAVVGLKPCFMMGPMSVAQYLEPGSIRFDLVVMDEASQIKPEDALGAIARGSQLVVVGDPKQLPPTSFFEREVEVEEETATALEDSESILDATLPVFRQRRLRWHYRSKHEALIAFSNQSFYGRDLVLFPSPNQRSKEFGLHHVSVARGAFSMKRNLEEARVIAEAVRSHFLHNSDESLGVVAMSDNQRSEIERAIEALAKEDPLFRGALEENQHHHEKLLLKNLENVQGDERDVIFISMTYGPPEPGGRVFQRFGPINSSGGWRRLNVLFTRSRRRMHVFTSMSSDDIIVGPSTNRGVKVLKEFLAYAETGILAAPTSETDREPDSDFEVAVAESLRRHGFECEPQVGVAGFFIDIGVRDPGNPGRFLMGVECDGASYHSAKSVRDRDRLRQQILERLGWRIRRIWSTDWFRNSEAQLGPILSELALLRSQPQPTEPEWTQSQDIEFIVERADGEERAVARYGREAGSLREQLVRFDREVIRTKIRGTSESQRLLRGEMLDAFCQYHPTSRSEYLERVPRYLRNSCAEEETGYLERVFAIIALHQRAEQEA